MAIYRGVGGSGDATNDASVAQVTAAQLAADAAAVAAAASAAASSASASDASASEIAAAASESALYASEIAAAASESAAAASESAAAASESAAAASAASVVRDGSGGVAGLTLFKINMRNVADTITSFFTNTNTAERTYTLPDTDGTVAMTSDITGTNSGTNTGDQTITLTGGVTGTGTGSFAATVVTNADLTGVVTSTGNATAIADAALSIAKTSGLQTALDANAAKTGRNRIINGNMAIDQRNAGASVTGSAFPVDRWRQDTTAHATFSYQRNAGAVTPPTGFTNYLGITSTAAYTPAANTTSDITQGVEGFNTSDFAWGTANAQTVTLSFWVRSSLTGTHSGALVNNAITRSYVFSFTVSSANTWEYKTIVVPGDITGVWATDNSAGVYLRFNTGTGTGTYGSTTTGWQAGNIVGLSNAVQISSVSGATFYITGVQLEKGSTATVFEYRPYNTELSLCQRYYQTVSIRVPTAAEGASQASIVLPVRPRTTPTVSGGGGGFIAALSDTGTYTQSQTTADFNTLAFSSEL